MNFFVIRVEFDIINLFNFYPLFLTGKSFKRFKIQLLFSAIHQNIIIGDKDLKLSEKSLLDCMLSYYIFGPSEFSGTHFLRKIVWLRSELAVVGHRLAYAWHLPSKSWPGQFKLLCWSNRFQYFKATAFVFYGKAKRSVQIKWLFLNWVFKINVLIWVVYFEHYLSYLSNYNFKKHCKILFNCVRFWEIYLLVLHLSHSYVMFNKS